VNRLLPKVSAQWHPTLNSTLKPENVRPQSNVKVFWQCPNTCSDECQHVWSTTVGSRQQHGCPYCAGRQVCCSEASLDQPKYAHIVHQWNMERNGGLIPSMFRPGSGQKIWWRCLSTCQDSPSCRHKWQTSIRDRCLNYSGCPFCTNCTVIPCCHHTSLLGRFPLVAAEWHTTKNDPLTPCQVYPMSSKKVWWTCLRNSTHQAWHTSICHRTNNQSGCPSCNWSHMERHMASILQDLNFTFEHEHRLCDTRRLRVDYLITLTDVHQIVIELDGRQHFDPEHYFFQGHGQRSFDAQQESDLFKEDWCRKHHYHLLRISFSIEYDQYADLVSHFVTRVREDPQTWQYVCHGDEY